MGFLVASYDWIGRPLVISQRQLATKKFKVSYNSVRIMGYCNGSLGPIAQPIAASALAKQVMTRTFKLISCMVLLLTASIGVESRSIAVCVII